MQIQLGQMQFWQVLILAVMFLTTIIFLSLKGKIGISLFGKSAIYRHPQRKKLKHIECPIVTDIILIMDKVTEISIKKCLIKTREILYDQMSYLGDRTEETKRYYQNEFMILLKSKNGFIDDDVSKHRDYQFFSILLTTILEEATDFLRASFTRDRNFFITSNDADFRTYIQEKQTTLGAKTVQYLELMYTKPDVVTLKEVLTIMTRQSPVIEPIFHAVLFSAREIAKANTLKITKLDKELEEFITKYLGKL